MDHGVDRGYAFVSCVLFSWQSPGWSVFWRSAASTRVWLQAWSGDIEKEFERLALNWTRKGQTP